MLKRERLLTLVTLSLALAIPVSSSPAASVKADRGPLTFRDSGLYCNLGFQHCHKAEDDGVTSMLTPERAASPESPWSFYVCQGAVAANAELIERMAANGKKLIVRVDIGRLSENPNVDEMEQILVRLLKDIDPDWLYAITLGEEQVFWNGWAGALTELYHRAKKRWPDLPVYQWWTPMEVPDARSTSAWVALPADGWIIDLYGEPRLAFEKKVVRALETGKPLVHIVWSSPDWPDYMGAKSWDEGGRQVFDDQLDVCRSYNVPVAHFCTQNDIRKDGKVVEQIRWGWHAVKPLVRDWYRQIEVMAENNRRLPDTAIGYRALDKTLFDWAHESDGPRGLLFRLDERGRKQVSLTADLSQVPLEAGEHPVSLGEADRYFKMTCVLDDSAPNLKPGMAVAGATGRPVGASIVFRIDPVVPVANLSFTANAYAHNDLGGSASVCASADGKVWSEPVSSDPKNQNHSLIVRRPGTDYVAASVFGKEPLWVRVQLSANSGTETGAAASLSAVLSAAVAPPLN